MKIAALRLFNVKRFADRGVAIENIGDGVNVLCAVNEFGKSTSFEALHALFFQPYSSTASDVRNLRPYSGGNPLVQADIATKDGQFRITKQFYAGRSAQVTDLATGRLVAQADEAENFIADLVKGSATGPAGLLWVRQGMTGIEKRTRSEEDSDTQVRASLLESVQGEVEAVTGGRRMAEIMATTAEALSRLVTPTGRPRTGENYATTVETRDRLEAEERELGAEVAALRKAIDDRAVTTKRLSELDRAEDREQRKQEIEVAQIAFDAAKSQAETLRATEAELKLVQEQRDAVTKDLKVFRDALDKAKALQSQLIQAEHRRAEARDKQQDASAAIGKARADAEAAEAEEQEARTLLARLDASLRAREAGERLAELEKRLAAAEAARRDIEECEAAIALLKLPEQTVAELERLEVEIAALRAVEELGKPSVSVAYDKKPAAEITMAGDTLKDREHHSYDEQAVLAVPGIGILTLRSNRTTGKDNDLKQAEEKRQTLLASIGLENVAAVRKREVEVQQKDGALRDAKGRLSLLAPDGLPKLRETVAARGAAALDVLELKGDPAQVRAAQEAAEARRLAARQTLREVEPLQAMSGDAVMKAELALATLTTGQSQVEVVLGPEETRIQRERALAGKLSDLETKFAAAEATVLEMQAKSIDLASAEAAFRRASSVADATEKEIATLRETLAGLTAEIRARSEDAVEEKWRETTDALAAEGARVVAYEKEVAILQRIRVALETARSQARDTYLKPVMTELRPLLGLLFEDVSITFDEKTLLPHKILRSGLEEDVERLSGGMREQLSVLTRLAFARLLAREGRPTPVILDDALVYSDDDRIEKMFDALHRQARDQQIIVFSCRQRAFQKLGGNVLRMTDWHP